MIWINSNLLSISNILIISKHIMFLFSFQNIYWSCHWSWILTNTSSCYLISFFNIWNLISKINTHPSLSLSVLNHYIITPSQVSILAVWPWYLLVTLLVSTYSFSEWICSSTLFTIIVRLLNLTKSHVFIPVTNLCFVVIFWTTL